MIEDKESIENGNKLDNFFHKISEKREINVEKIDQEKRNFVDKNIKGLDSDDFSKITDY